MLIVLIIITSVTLIIALTVSDKFTNISKVSQNLLSQINIQNSDISTLKSDINELKELSISLRDPIERPFVLSDFNSQEIHILRTHIGMSDIHPFVPVYNVLKEQHPDLYKKYENYLRNGGETMESLLKRHEII